MSMFQLIATLAWAGRPCHKSTAGSAMADASRNMRAAGNPVVQERLALDCGERRPAPSPPSTGEREPEVVRHRTRSFGTRAARRVRQGGSYGIAFLLILFSCLTARADVSFM